MVVDNGSEDGTAHLVKELMKEHANLHYVFEPEVGLSRARNRGWLEAGTPWVGYVDDDARLPEGFVERALWIMEHYDFDCFGGMYYAWYKYGKPRWLPDEFGNKQIPQTTTGELTEDYLSGGNFFIKRQVLKKSGGFPTAFGMKGDAIGYGEEDRLQDSLKKLGYRIGFDPELKIYHAVLPHKLHLSWHLWSFYASSRDQQKNNQSSLLLIFILFFRSLIASMIIKLPLAFFKLGFKRGFYWQNLILEVFMPIWYRMGQIVGYFSQIHRRIG